MRTSMGSIAGAVVGSAGVGVASTGCSMGATAGRVTSAQVFQTDGQRCGHGPSCNPASVAQRSLVTPFRWSDAYQISSSYEPSSQGFADVATMV